MRRTFLLCHALIPSSANDLYICIASFTACNLLNSALNYRACCGRSEQAFRFPIKHRELRPRMFWLTPSESPCGSRNRLLFRTYRNIRNGKRFENPAERSFFSFSTSTSRVDFFGLVRVFPGQSLVNRSSPTPRPNCLLVAAFYRSERLIDGHICTTSTLSWVLR